MIIATVDQMKKLDEWAIVEAGIPRLLLMEGAGRSVASNLTTAFGKVDKCVVVAGKGNNGGDGLVAARHLFASGSEVEVFLPARKSELAGEVKTNLEIAEKLGIKVTEIGEGPSLKLLEESLKGADAVIDAIFGIGFSGDVLGAFAGCIDLINDCKTRITDKKPYHIVSVDIPSGLNADTGSFGSHCVKADMTVTFTYIKRGLLQYPAMDMAGKLVIADIGIPKTNPLDTVKGAHPSRAQIKLCELDIITSEYVANKIPQRDISAHKGLSGEVFIVAGSLGMMGAAAMAAKSALRVGAGLVRVGVPDSLAIEFNSIVPEVITVPLPETKEISLSPKAVQKVMEFYERSDAIAIGPGLSAQKETVQFVSQLFEALAKADKKTPILIDADAINALAGAPSILKNSKLNLILTPHPGEMSRLARLQAEDIQKRRVEVAKEISRKFSAVVVLKGARTIVADPDGRALINLTGNPGMASAGMGDVLTGAISGLLAQGLTPFDASACAVFVHGMAGDVVASLKGEHGIIASDLIEALPYVIKSTLQ